MKLERNEKIENMPKRGCEWLYGRKADWHWVWSNWMVLKTLFEKIQSNQTWFPVKPRRKFLALLQWNVRLPKNTSFDLHRNSIFLYTCFSTQSNAEVLFKLFYYFETPLPRQQVLRWIARAFCSCNPRNMESSNLFPVQF